MARDGITDSMDVSLSELREMVIAAMKLRDTYSLDEKL